MTYSAQFVQTQRSWDFVVAASIAAVAAYFRLNNVTILVALVVGAIVLRMITPTGLRRPRLRVTALLLPAIIITSLVGRSILMTGYPAYPLAIGAVPVSWRVPQESVESLSMWIRSWSRAPGQSPDQVLGNWNWFPGWINWVLGQPLIQASQLLILLGMVVVVLLWVSGDRPRGRESITKSALIILIPLQGLMIWFFLAPDIRFGWGFVATTVGSLTAVCFCAANWQRESDETRRRLFRGAAGALALIVVTALAWTPFQPFTQLALPRDTADLRGGGLYTYPLVAWSPRGTTDVTLIRPSAGYECGNTVWCTPYPNENLTVRRFGPTYVVRVAD
jgi:hypothetical protein